MSFVITDAEDITPEWLTEVLRRNCVLESGEVSQIRSILSRTLQVSRVIRLAMDYSSDAPKTAPASLFLKLSRSDTDPLVNDRSEVEFYQKVAVRTVGPIVRCYDSAFSDETNSSHLLLEDLSGTHIQPRDGQLPSASECEAAVMSLAELHSQWWEHPEVGTKIGSFFDKDWLEKFLSDLERSIAAFLSYLGDDISADKRRIYERLLLSSRKIWGRLTDPAGLTVTNGDLHWWNFLYPKYPTKDRIRIIDWQLWHIDLGARDLAFLIALGGFAKERHAAELDLLRLYHRTLLVNGVKNYEWNSFWNDYRFSAIRNLNMPVIFWSQGKHDTTWKNAMHRAFQSFDELGCIELLDP